MLKDNLIMLRNMYGMSQEEISEKIGISRQAYAKWESGSTIPDIEKCKRLADFYDVTIDSLLKTEVIDKIGTVPPAPKGKYIWGNVTMNDSGQLVIPKAAREKFGWGGGQRMIVLGDEEGLAILSAETFESKISSLLEYASITENKD